MLAKAEVQAAEISSGDVQERADYERIAQAIEFMRQHQFSCPDLATIAQQVHLSESHFQRLFTRWAGISPKRFSQYLTIEYAKSKIAQTKSFLDLTSEVGLSSPGRLHDLFVTLEAMSPGEFKAQGTGLTIQYGIHETPFGQALIASTDRGICDLHFLADTEVETAQQRLQLKWGECRFNCRSSGYPRADRSHLWFGDRSAPGAVG